MAPRDEDRDIQGDYIRIALSTPILAPADAEIVYDTRDLCLDLAWGNLCLDLSVCVIFGINFIYYEYYYARRSRMFFYIRNCNIS